MSLNQNWSTDEIANADRIAGANSLVPNLGGELDLQKSLISLSLLPTGVGQVGLESLLRQIAEFAVRAIPGADGAGLTLLETGRADTIVSTSKFAEDVGTLQVSVGEGPSPSAIAERRTVRCGSLGEQPQWAKFGPRVIRLGVHSAMSLPLRAADLVAGAETRRSARGGTYQSGGYRPGAGNGDGPGRLHSRGSLRQAENNQPGRKSPPGISSTANHRRGSPAGASPSRYRLAARMTSGPTGARLAVNYILPR
jgi:hypothetical protein